MPIVTAPAPSLDSIRRAKEEYTPVFTAVNDNDANFVTVLDITGRGVLVAIGFISEGSKDVTVQVTIDGVADSEVFQSLGHAANTSAFANGMTMDFGFETDCKVEMKLAAADVASYWGVANVE